ncbi:MAG: hypothetical protein JRD89_01125 [Deltaproteobacteria bacterium]|nr:hypothetical protein [Deltaproteobacteria bacterium]
MAERDPFVELEQKYGISGYDDSNIIVSYDVFKSLVEKAEKWDKYAHLILEMGHEGRKLVDRLEAIKKPLFYLQKLLETPPALECVSWKDDEGIMHSRFDRETFEMSLKTYLKAGLERVKEIRAAVEGADVSTKQREDT